MTTGDDCLKRVNKILANREYLLLLSSLEETEKARQFCSHHFDHLLDVARLGYILLLEESSPFISRDMVYAAGLLHDIGRPDEHLTGADHALKSAELAGPILEEAGYKTAERQLIMKAIAQHRLKGQDGAHRSPLSRALARADGFSRLCFRCDARSGCRRLEQQPHKERLVY